MIRNVLCSLMLVLIAPSVVAELAAPERRMVEFIDAHTPDAESLLEASVNINSGTMNFAGVRAVGELLMPHFSELGFQVDFVSGEAFQRAGHLIAKHEGGDGPNLLLIGHLDTVFEPDSPFQSFTRLPDNKATGPGVSDMKGGNVILLQALRALHHIGALEAMNVHVVLTGDEELSGDPLSLSKRAIVESAEWADIAIGFEDGDGNPATANISRRGAADWTLRVTGVPAHSSQVFKDAVGAGAIYEIARILHQFYDELRSEALLTFNPGRIVGGTTLELDPTQNRAAAFGKTNVVAESAVVVGDLRAISPEQLARAQSVMTDIVQNNLPQTTATITFEEGYPPMAPTDGNRALLAMLGKVSADLGQGDLAAVNPLNAGAADISFAADFVEMAIDGLGLSGTGGHTVNETADLSKLPAQAKRAAVLMYRLQQ